MNTRLARRKAFHCLQSFAPEQWMNEKDASVTGAALTPQGHGRNFEMEVYLEGPVGRETGMIVNLADFDAVLERVVAPLNGKSLNQDIPEFEGRTPSAESLAAYLFERVKNEIAAPARLAKLRLYAHADLWVDVWP